MFGIIRRIANKIKCFVLRTPKESYLCGLFKNKDDIDNYEFVFNALINNKIKINKTGGYSLGRK